METAPTNEYILWIAVIAYAAHIMEEYTWDWKNWAEDLSDLAIGWEAFFVTNAAVIVLGVACAQIGWRCPAVSLMFPALMLINGLFFHLGPTLGQRRFSPGTLTAVVFFLPIGSWAFLGARQDGVLTPAVVIISIVGGAVIMAYPILLLRIKNKPTENRKE